MSNLRTCECTLRFLIEKSVIFYHNNSTKKAYALNMTFNVFKFYNSASPFVAQQNLEYFRSAWETRGDIFFLMLLIMLRSLIRIWANGPSQMALKGRWSPLTNSLVSPRIIFNLHSAVHAICTSVHRFNSAVTVVVFVATDGGIKRRLLLNPSRSVRLR